LSALVISIASLLLPFVVVIFMSIYPPPVAPPLLIPHVEHLDGMLQRGLRIRKESCGTVVFDRAVIVRHKKDTGTTMATPPVGCLPSIPTLFTTKACPLRPLHNTYIYIPHQK
jgi:hypothetical protein